MKKLIQNFRTGELKVEQVPIPHLKENGILVKNHYSVVSVGTEKAVIEFAKQHLVGKAKKRPDLVSQVINKIKTDGLMSAYKTALHRLEMPLPLGNSCAGEIIEAGIKASEFNKADLVACGGGGYASHAEVVFVPKNLCVKIPHNVSTKEASFVTLGAIAMQGIRMAVLSPGEKVAVTGLGLIGQLTIQILNAYGFHVIGLDIDKNKLKRAQELGLKHGAVIGEIDIVGFINDISNGYGVDAVIIAAATKSNKPIEIAGKISRDKGRISIVGDVHLQIPRNLYYEKELTLTVSRSSGAGRYDARYEEKGIDYPIGYARWTEKRNMEEFLRLISLGRVDVQKMISHIFKIEDASKAYELMLQTPSKQEFNSILLEYDVSKEREYAVIHNTRKKEKIPKDGLYLGLIGAGNFAKTIILPAIKKMKTVKLKAIADAQGEMAKFAANKCHCEYITSDYRELLNDEEIDLIIIATRHNLHARITAEALRKNKNVHVEKPLALNIEELKEIIKAEQESKGRIMVGFNRRFAPFSVEAKKMLSNINSPLLIHYRISAGYIPEGNWIHDSEEGGGRIIGEVCHFVDLLQYFANSPPISVYATRVSAKKPIIENDNIEIIIEFANGSRGSILYTALGSKLIPKEYIEIFADEKAITINNFKSGTFYDKQKSKKIKRAVQDKGHYYEIEAFTQAILKGNHSPISLDEQILSTLVTFKILESLKRKEPVKISVNEIYNIK